MNRIQVISLLALFLAAINVGLAESLPFAITNAAEQKAEGEALVRQLLAQRPEASFSQNGWLKIRDGSGKKSEAALRFDTIVTTTNWSVVYDVAVTNSKGYTDGNLLKATHTDGEPTKFIWSNMNTKNIGSYRSDLWNEELSGTQFIVPFFQSDFWAVDLSLEYLHWPDQRVTRKELCRTRSCKVLESVNPQPGTNGYSKVRTWIDRDTLGVIFAEAYDANGKLLKEFSPKGISKVDGQWRVGELEMRNVQTGSRSRLVFDLTTNGTAASGLK